MVKKLFIILFPIVLLCGCAATEPNDKYLVSLIGVEESDGQVDIYYKYSDIADNSSVKSISAKGKTLFDAYKNINLSLDKMPSLSHCEVIVLSENTDKTLFGEIMDFCRKKELPLKLRLAVTDDMNSLFFDKNTLSGVDLSGMLKVVYSTYGFGGHTALYEIETAISIGADFALPFFEVRGKSVEICGLGLYKNCDFMRKIGIYESCVYAKNNI